MKIIRSNPKIKPYTFTKSDRNFILLLENDELLEPLIINLRRSANIPIEGINLESIDKKDYLQNNISKIEIVVLWHGITRLRALYKAPIGWATSFLSLLIFNILTPPDGSLETVVKPIEIVYDESLEKLGLATSQVNIIIRKRASVEQIKKFLYAKDNKEYLDNILSQLPRESNLSKVKNIERGSIIETIKKQNPKATLDEIANELTKKLSDHSNPDSGFDYDDIPKIMHRFTDLMNKYIKRNSTSRVLASIKLSVSDFRLS